jgi:hypothetical protein
MTDTNLQELFILFRRSCDEENILVPLLEKCPLLEDLRLEKLEDEVLVEITKSLKSGNCPLLKNISSYGVRGYARNHKGMHSLLYAVGHKDVDSSSFNVYPTRSESDNEQRGLATYIQGFSGIEWCTALTERHAQTMTRLEFESNILLSVTTLADIAQGLPRLKNLRIGLCLSDSPLDSERIKLLQRPWALKDLQDLTIDFTLPYHVKNILDPAWSGSAIDQYMTWIFSGIGESTQLKSLDFDNPRDLLSLILEPCYLLKLSELKQLKKLHFHCFLPEIMGSAEAEWMIDNWPRLIEVNIYEEARWSCSGLSEFKAVLKERRPWLQLKI